MSDWRSNPRTGKSTFMPLLSNINERIKLGENVKMIYDSYIEENTIEMSYPQFTRYVKRYCIGEQKNTSEQKKLTEEKKKEKTPTEIIISRNKDNDDLFQSYLDACFKNKIIATRAFENNVPIEKIIEWKAPNSTRLGTFITNYIMNK